jgi:copper chaperone CopZ
MVKNTLKIDGMMCSMCEAHVNDVIRKVVPDAKKVSSSHAKGESTFVSESQPDEETLRNAIAETGYKLLEMSSEEGEQKGFLGKLFGKK